LIGAQIWFPRKRKYAKDEVERRETKGFFKTSLGIEKEPENQNEFAVETNQR